MLTEGDSFKVPRPLGERHLLSVGLGGLGSSQ